MNNDKNRVLFSLACGAVLSVATFSGIGIAAITGQLTVSPSSGDLFSGAANQGNRSQSGSDVDVVASPTHVGLTRKAINNANENEGAMVIRVGQRFSQTLKPPCTRCGIVDSIERHDLQMPANTNLITGTTNQIMSQKPFPGPTASVGDLTTSFIVRLRMEDGSIRTIYEHQRPKFSVGEKIKLVNGSVVSLS